MKQYIYYWFSISTLWCLSSSRTSRRALLQTPSHTQPWLSTWHNALKYNCTPRMRSPPLFNAFWIQLKLCPSATWYVRIGLHQIKHQTLPRPESAKFPAVLGRSATSADPFESIFVNLNFSSNMQTNLSEYWSSNPDKTVSLIALDFRLFSPNAMAVSRSS